MTGLYNFFNKHGQLFAIVLGLIAIAMFLIPVFSGIESAGYSTGDDLNQIMKSNPDAKFNFFVPGIKFTTFMAGAAAFLAILAGLIQTVLSPKNSIKMLLGIAVLVALYFIYYSSADLNYTGRLATLIQDRGIDEGTSRMISAGIHSVVTLSGIALVSAVLMELWNAFK